LFLSHCSNVTTVSLPLTLVVQADPCVGAGATLLGRAEGGLRGAQDQPGAKKKAFSQTLVSQQAERGRIKQNSMNIFFASFILLHRCINLEFGWPISKCRLISSEASKCRWGFYTLFLCSRLSFKSKELLTIKPSENKLTKKSLKFV
jgi:hypothetical protein